MIDDECTDVVSQEGLGKVVDLSKLKTNITINPSQREECWLSDTLRTDEKKRQGIAVEGSLIPTFEEGSVCYGCNGHRYGCGFYKTRKEMGLE